MSQAVAIGLTGHSCAKCEGGWDCSAGCMCPRCSEQPGCRTERERRELVADVANHLYLLSGRTMPGGLQWERPGFKEKYEYRAQELVKFFIKNKARLND